MPRKRKSKPDDPKRSKRATTELSHELAADSDKKSFERTFRKIAGIKKPSPDDPAQSKRFIETARKIGAGETEESAERALKKLDLRKQDKVQFPKK